MPPRRSSPSDTEAAVAGGELDTVITHPDGTFTKGGSLEFGMNLGEIQIPSGSDLLNLGDLELLGQTGSLAKAPTFNGDDFNPTYTLDSFSTDVDLGVIQRGDILSYSYTLNAFGRTHGFERGYFAFVGDPFGVDVLSDNLSVAITPVGTADAPEGSTCLLMLLGLAGVFAGRWRPSQK